MIHATDQRNPGNLGGLQVALRVKPVRGTPGRAIAQSGSASVWGTGGREFESPWPDQC